MNDKPYLIPAELAQFEEEIKKSVFITYLAHTPSIEAAKAFVDQIKAKQKEIQAEKSEIAAAKLVTKNVKKTRNPKEV